MRNVLLLLVFTATNIIASTREVSSYSYITRKDKTDSVTINKWGKGFHQVGFQTGETFAFTGSYGSFGPTLPNFGFVYSHHFRNTPISLQGELNVLFTMMHQNEVSGIIQFPLLFKLDFTNRKVNGGIYIGFAPLFYTGERDTIQSYGSGPIKTAVTRKASFNFIFGFNVDVPLKNNFGLLFDTRINAMCFPIFPYETQFVTRSSVGFYSLHTMFHNIGFYYRWNNIKSKK